MADRKYTSNTQLKDMLIEWRSDSNNRISTIEKEQGRQSAMLLDHEVILNGDKKNPRDQGIVGMIVDLTELVENIKTWVKPLILSLMGWALLAGLQKLLEVVATVSVLAK